MSHDNEGDWQFLCEQNNHKEKNISIITLKQTTDIGQAINDLNEMPLGVCAKREKVNDKWATCKTAE